MEVENAKKQLMIEYILTNGTLPGFLKRFEEILPSFSISTEPFVVYRGQGHSKPGIAKIEGVSKQTLIETKKPISTSKNIERVIKFTDGERCCIFEIMVEPGIRFFDFDLFSSDTLSTHDINEFMNLKSKEDPADLIWPYNKFWKKKRK
jgi:hypothetical protein